MEVPDDFKDTVEKDRLRNLEDRQDEPLIILKSAAGGDSDPEKLGLDWELVDSGGEGFNFKLIYTNPLEVSQNDVPDKVKIILNLD